MQQYLFRGKRKDNGEWAFGSLVSTSIDEAFILLGVTGHIKRDDYECYMVEVKPETVGMYIDRIDKNGKNIYDGDIVQFISTESYEYDVDYDYEKLGDTPVRSVMRWNEEACGFRTTAQSRFKVTSDMLEVVGNCFDNPELVNPAVKDSVINTMKDPNLAAANQTTEQAEQNAQESASQDQAMEANAEEATEG
jgi:uncharacterized phage protein (TIGR01671 family)